MSSSRPCPPQVRCRWLCWGDFGSGGHVVVVSSDTDRRRSTPQGLTRRAEALREPRISTIATGCNRCTTRHDATHGSALLGGRSLCEIPEVVTVMFPVIELDSISMILSSSSLCFHPVLELNKHLSPDHHPIRTPPTRQASPDSYPRATAAAGRKEES